MKCGFKKLDITPALGCHLMGYPAERIADAVLDPLHVRCAAFQDGGTAISFALTCWASLRAKTPRSGNMWRNM